MSGGADRDDTTDREREKAEDRNGSKASDPGWTVASEAQRQEGADPRPVFYCDLCGNIMLDVHCKLICETCGYRRDCSDP